MQLTKELLVQEIAQSEAQVVDAKSNFDRASGALATLKNVLKYLEQPDPIPEAPRTDISPENAAIQAADEARMAMYDEAVPLELIAEAVAGPGATVEIEPFDDRIVRNG